MPVGSVFFGHVLSASHNQLIEHVGGALPFFLAALRVLFVHQPVEFSTGKPGAMRDVVEWVNDIKEAVQRSPQAVVPVVVLGCVRVTYPSCPTAAGQVKEF